jgi:hypothetical protein
MKQEGLRASAKLEAPDFLLATFAYAFVCLDNACSWESGEALLLHFHRFQVLETSVCDEDGQILQAAPPSMEAHSLARSI